MLPTTKRFLLAVLLLGVVVRIVTFFLLTPNGNDNHYIIVKAIAIAKTIPRSGEANMTQAYHPPLYYLLAVPFYHLADAKGIQFLSLLLSVATLIVAWRFLLRLSFIPDHAKPWLFLLPAFHPQFLIYSLLVSNDSLAFLIGFLIFNQWALLLQFPGRRQQVVLAILLGLGLLTKATFLAYILPVVISLVLVAEKSGRPAAKAFFNAAGLLLISLIIGSYKFVENLIFEGTPLISGLDYDRPWIAMQRPTWIGPMSLFDINIFKLIANPIIDESTVHSWSLLLYGSFWYSHIPECSFRSNLTPFNMIGSLIYAVAVVPTIVFIAGAIRHVQTISKSNRMRHDSSDAHLCTLALITFAFNLILVEYAGWKYDVWSVFHGRLLFPSYAGFILLLAVGWNWLTGSRFMDTVVRVSLGLLAALFLFYLGVEAVFSIQHPVDPATRNHMPPSLIPNMNAVPK